MATKILKKDTVFQSKYFSVEKILVKQKGKTFTKDLVKRKDVVLVLPITKNNELYLVSQYRIAWEEKLLEVVTGNIEEGQSPLDAAKAELEEEAGLLANTWEQLGTFFLSANISGLIHLFVAKDLGIGKANPNSDEEIQLVKLSLDEVMKKVLDGKIRAMSNITAILFFDKVVRERNKIV